MAQTGKLGIADSRLGNVLLAFAGDAPLLPSTGDMSGRLATPAAMLGNVLLGLGGPDGPMVIHLWAESVVALGQAVDCDAEIVGHIPPAWAMGSPDWQLGDAQLGFVGADDPLPALGARSGRLGVGLGNLVLAIAGAVGANVIHVSATSSLAIAGSAIVDPEIAPHASPRWALGGIDSPVGKMQLAYVEEAPRPLTGTMTGKLGTIASLLGNMRAALGEEEGGGGANIAYATAENGLSLASEAGVTTVLSCAASSPIELTEQANATRALVCVAQSVLTVTDTAARNNLLAGSAESQISLDIAAVYTASRAVAAESTLVLTDAAANIGGQLIEAAAESTLILDVTADFTVARAASAESALALADVAGRNNLLGGSAESVASLDVAADFAVVRAVTAESTLALADAAGRNNLLSASAESVISLTVEAARVLPAVIDVAAESPISLTVAAGRNNIVAAAATSALDLTSAATCVHVVPTPVAAESALILDTTAACAVVRPVSAWDFLWELQSEASVAVVRKLAAHNTIVLAQAEVTARPWYLAAETPLQTVTYEYDQATDTFYQVYEGLQDSAHPARPLTATAQQSIPLAQSATGVRVKPNAINVSAESVLELLGEIRVAPTGGAGNWLTLGQAATVDKCKLVRSALNLTDEAAVTHTGPRGAGSALNLGQAATYYLVSAGVLQRYHPFIGAGAPGAPTPPPETLDGPLPGVTEFQLVYPATGTVIDSVTLRAPNFGNKDRLSFNRVLRETRGGTLIVFADPMWPKIQTLVLNFSGLRSDKAQELLTFLDAHLGEEVGVYDWEHRYWTGVIITPTEPVVQDGKDSFSASFEFEGELVPA